jgi:CelD/BcsL family acetyltransferase involved in cellulose biosynthesis
LTTPDSTSRQLPTTPRAIVVGDETELAPYLEEWDALAVASERPFCAPGWMLAWWREGRSGHTRLQVVLVLDGDRLIGVGPFFAQISYGLAELRLLGAGFSHRIGPLAREGEEGRVAAAMAEALAALKPRPAGVVFEGIDVEDPWPELLAEAWPARRPRLRTDSVMEAPVIRLDADDEAWMERRTRNFRKLARRTSKRLGETEVRKRIGADESAVRGFLQLHHQRWKERGGSNLDDSAERVVAAAAAELGEKGRLEIVLLEGPEGPISAELMLRTGPVATIWATGFDPAWAQYAPGLQVRLVTLRAAAEHGVQLVDLGGGGDEYKKRMADADMPIAWRTLFPRGPRYPLILLRLAPKRIRYALRGAVDRLPEPQRKRLAKLLRRRT